jgi:hypothetical protein
MSIQISTAGWSVHEVAERTFREKQQTAASVSTLADDTLAPTSKGCLSGNTKKWKRRRREACSESEVEESYYDVWDDAECLFCNGMYSKNTKMKNWCSVQRA